MVGVEHAPKISIAYSGGLSAIDWKVRHDKGEVPDEAPYGLNYLRDADFSVYEVSDSQQRSSRIHRRLTRRLGGGLDWLRRFEAADLDCDILFAWDERTGLPAATYHGRSIPVVSGFIWATDSLSKQLRLATRLASPSLAGAFVLSEAQVTPLRELLGSRSGPVQPIMFGVDADFFTPSPVGDSEGRNLNRLVTVGNDRDRDFETLLRAFALARTKRPGLELTAVTKAIHPQNVPEGVTIERELSHGEVRHLIRTSLATLTITKPNLHVSGMTAFLESMSCGTAAVATKTDGAQAYAARGGLHLVDVGDVNQIAYLIRCLTEDPANALHIGEAGRQAVEAEFNTAAMSLRVAGFLSSVLR